MLKLVHTTREHEHTTLGIIKVLFTEQLQQCVCAINGVAAMNI